MSIAFFHPPNYDAMIARIPGCTAALRAGVVGEFRDYKYTVTCTGKAA